MGTLQFSLKIYVIVSDMAESLENLSYRQIIRAATQSSLVEFIATSQLPWSLMENVLKIYGSEKWEQLREEAQGERPFRSLANLEYTRELDHSERIEAVTTQDWSMHFYEDVYCVWFNQYYIPDYRLHLCYECFKAFRKVMQPHHPFHSIRDHKHVVYSVHSLNDLFQNPSSWCHNRFDEVLFTLKSGDECNYDLHSYNFKGRRFETPPPFHRFIGYEEEDSDLD